MDTQPNEIGTQSGNSEHHDDHRMARTSGWVGGVILIAMGLFLLLQNLTGFTLNNWWALFILIPAVGALGRAWKRYQDAGGRLTAEARSALFGGVILILVAAIFLFGWSWSLFGPILLLLLGISLLANSLIER